jgi:hypothetical protein
LKRGNDVQKNTVIAFVIGLALGILGTAGAVLFTGRSGGFGELTELDRANQQRTAEAVTGLERTVGEQRERITELEQSNNRLAANNRDARGIVEQLVLSTGTETTNIRSAIALYQKIADQIKSLDDILSRGDTSGGGPGDMGGLETGGEVKR